jgi:hypothetical protein
VTSQRPAAEPFEPEPHDVAAEQCVLGGMLLSKGAISDVIEVIGPADHYRPAHQLVHEAILGLFGRGEPVDAITVASELTRRGEITRVGGGPYLHTLIASVPTAANAGYYARIVRELAERRELIEAGNRLVTRGRNLSVSVASLRELTRKAVEKSGQDRPSAAAGRRIVLTPASEIIARPVRWIWDTAARDAPPASREGRLPVGSLALAAGWAGLGKSQFAAWLAARITKGTLPGCLYGHPRSVIYAAREDSWEMTIKPRLEAAGADVERVYRVDVVDDQDPHARLTLPADIALLGQAIREYGVALVVLDPLLSAVDGQINDFRSAEVRTALEPLKELADVTKALLLGLAHFTKAGGGDPLLRIAGAAAFGEVVRAALGFAPNDSSPEGDGDGDQGSPDAPFILSTIKNNLGRDRDLPSLGYQIVPATVETPEGPSYVSRFELTGESATSVRDIMAGAFPGQQQGERSNRTSVDDAAEWLKGYLGKHGVFHEGCGCREANRDAIVKAAKADEISESTLKRAVTKAGVTTERVGFGEGSLWWAGSCRSHSDHHSAHSAHAQNAELNGLNVDRMESPTQLRTAKLASLGNTDSDDRQPVLLAARDPVPPTPAPDCGHPECQLARAGECLTDEQRAAVRVLDPKAFGDASDSTSEKDPAA